MKGRLNGETDEILKLEGKIKAYTKVSSSSAKKKYI